jgi:phenylalanyl-tRNA synthetase beta chain
MPTIDIDYQELERELGINLNGDMEKLDEILSYIKAEVKGYSQKENLVSIEMKDTARADLWSVEGLSRALQGYLNRTKGMKEYVAGQSIIEINVSPKLSTIRPYICCSVIKEIHLSDAIIKGIMHLQDKLDQTYGRNRQKTSIGIYNLDLIDPPIQYTAVAPHEVKFVPLGFTEKMNLDEILEQHPKGVEYGHIVKKNPLYPMLFDKEGKVLSFPPIINSNDLGKITEESRNLLVEVTGTKHQTVLNTLNLVTMALMDHGGKAYSATIHYPEKSEYTEKTVVTPTFSPCRFDLSVEYTNQLLGLQLSAQKISELLQTAGFGTGRVAINSVSVLVPSYRVDVMHPVDLVEDVAIAYGYNNIEPLWRDLPTTGAANALQPKIDNAREFMIGLGYQEILNPTLTNKETLFSKMNTLPTPIVEVSNPKVVTMTCLRHWLIPGLMEFLSANVSVEFPQKIFELGKITRLDKTKETQTMDEYWLSTAVTHPNANFTEIKSTLDSFMSNLGLTWQINEIIHPSFIEGRVGKIEVHNAEVGIVGEINPAVLNNWKLENPVAAFEIQIQRILDVPH